MSAKHSWLYKDPDYTPLRRAATRHPWRRWLIAAGVVVLLACALGAAFLSVKPEPVPVAEQQFYGVLAVQKINVGDTIAEGVVLRYALPEPIAGPSEPSEVVGRIAYNSLEPGMFFQDGDYATEADSAFIRCVREGVR